DVSTFRNRRHTGVYDRQILCAECDSSFSPWEEYTAKLLCQTAPAYYKTARDGFYIIPEYDYAKLKLCLLSILCQNLYSALSHNDMNRVRCIISACLVLLRS